MLTTETAFWPTAAAEARIEARVASEMANVALLNAFVIAGGAILDQMTASEVTICDHGSVDDLRGLFEAFRPHGAAVIAMRAREVAWDEERERRMARDEGRI